MVHTRAIGMIGEDVAVKFLKSHRFTILGRNFLKKWGEIDIIAEKDGILNFIEVKSVSSETRSEYPTFHPPEENVSEYKLHKLRKVVQSYLWERGLNSESEFRFHVLTVILDMNERKGRVKWIKDIIL